MIERPRVRVDGRREVPFDPRRRMKRDTRKVKNVRAVAI